MGDGSRVPLAGDGSRVAQESYEYKDLELDVSEVQFEGGACPLQQAVEAGYTLREIKDAGYKAIEFKQASYTKFAAWWRAGYSLSELDEAGYSVFDGRGLLPILSWTVLGAAGCAVVCVGVGILLAALPALLTACAMVGICHVIYRIVT